MFKNNALIYAIIGIFLIVGGILFWNNYQVSVQEKPLKPINLPPALSQECGIEQCHGLDITCGPNVPEMCTMEYQAGDNCRQFVFCEVVEGECRLITTDEFESCKACVEKCEQDFADDPIEFFQCESQCAG